MHAVEVGSLESVRWILEQGVSPSSGIPRDRTLLHVCLERAGQDKYQILEELIAAGANVDERGFHGWTALHLAAFKEDEQAMQILLSSGADPKIMTHVDNFATAEEEARFLGKHSSAEFIASFEKE